MSTEDRVRAATRARTALVRDIRPLELPADLPVRSRRPRSAGRWLNWGAPLAAAALVAALALVLVLVRQAPGPRSGPVAPTSAAPAAAAVPRYYVVLEPLSVTPDPNPSSVNWKPTARPQAVVADDRTGRVLVSVPPPSGQSFTGVTAAADDRTFVLSGYDSVTRETTWYLLRFTPGAADPAKLEKLPVAPLASQISGLALSPDGRELAVMFAGASLQLRTYSVGSGVLLGTWQTDAPYWIPRAGGANAFGLSWLADGRHVSFRFDAYAKNSTVHLVTVRTLDVTAAGHDLLADSRLALQEPLALTQPAPFEPCFTSLATPDGNTVVCGTYVNGIRRDKGTCISAPVSLINSSATGGKVLYRYPGSCQDGWAVPLWTSASARDVIVGMDVTRADTGVEINPIGVITAGRFTELKVGLWAAVIQSDTLFPGNIAF
jgi:hypothetical protein